MRKQISFALFALSIVSAAARETYNFNSDWTIGDAKATVTLPRAWNEGEAFAVRSAAMSDSTVRYRKTFTLPKSAKGQRVIIEFEGVRQAAEVFVNGKNVGLHENGVTAFGFDITDFVNIGKNTIEVITDNDWNYAERSTGVKLPEVMVVSNSERVKLLLNGRELKAKAKRTANFLFKFSNITYERGTLTAIGYDKDGKEQSRYSLSTAGKAAKIKLAPIVSPAGWRADGADVALVQVEVVDDKGQRCPVDNSMIHFSIK